MTARGPLLVGCTFGAIVALMAAAHAAPAPEEPARGEAARGTISLDRPVPQAAGPQAPMGNPLWAIPLGSLTVTRERPLFTPSRRAPAPAVVAPAPPVVAPKVVARPPQPEHSNLTLIGTVVSESESIGVFLDQSTHNFIRLRTGEGHVGWILRSVKAREATLEKGSQHETLRLPARSVPDAPAQQPPPQPL